MHNDVHGFIHGVEIPGMEYSTVLIPGLIRNKSSSFTTFLKTPRYSACNIPGFNTVFRQGIVPRLLLMVPRGVLKKRNA